LCVKKASLSNIKTGDLKSGSLILWSRNLNVYGDSGAERATPQCLVGPWVEEQRCWLRRPTSIAPEPQPQSLPPPPPRSSTPSSRRRRAAAFADATAIITVAGDDIAHAQPATASDGRASPAGFVEEERCWVWVVAVGGRVDGTYRTGIQHKLRLCGRRRPYR
jgi:hypothetical protein